MEYFWQNPFPMPLADWHVLRPCISPYIESWIRKIIENLDKTIKNYKDSCKNMCNMIV